MLYNKYSRNPCIHVLLKNLDKMICKIITNEGNNRFPLNIDKSLIKIVLTPQLLYLYSSASLCSWAMNMDGFSTTNIASVNRDLQGQGSGAKDVWSGIFKPSFFLLSFPYIASVPVA